MSYAAEIEPDSLLIRDDWLQALALDLAERDSPPNGDTLASWRIAMQTVTPKTGRLLSLFGRRRVIRNPKGERVIGAGDRAYEGLPVNEHDLPDRLLVKRRVISALFALTEPYRTTVLLRYVGGLSLEDIAEQTLGSPGAVKSRIRRGLKHIRSRLGGSAEEVQELVFDTLLNVAHWPLGHRPQAR